MFFGSVLNVISAEQRVLSKQHVIFQHRAIGVRYDIPFNVKPEDLDAIIVLPFHRLLPCVELLAFVDVFSASITSP